MKPIKEAIEETLALGERLKLENPGLTSLSFSIRGYPLDDVRQAAEHYNEPCDLRTHSSRFGFLYSPMLSSVYIHVESVEVKAKIVYE